MQLYSTNNNQGLKDNAPQRDELLAEHIKTFPEVCWHLKCHSSIGICRGW